MFIDSSALIAILCKEDDAALLADKIEEASERFTSALVYLETVMRLTTKLAIDPGEIIEDVDSLLASSKISFVSLGEREAALAVDAFARYGKGRGHPAQLNLADCLSYACAKAHAIPLLYKGNDFAKTDLA